MWLGPAPKRSFNPNRFHGSWRWFFDYGTGDLGNDGVHRIDYARRFAREVCVIFANSAAGCSMTNSLQLASLLEGQRAEPRRGAGHPMATPLLPFRAA